MNVICSCGVRNTVSRVTHQVARHVRQLEFEFEIGHGAQPAHHDLHTVLAREVHCQACVTHDLDARNVREHLAREIHAFFPAGTSAPC
jgi:hypothetical protein